MEILLVIVFFLGAFIFFVVGKDDFGRKPLKVKEEPKAEVKEEVKSEVKEEPKAEVKEEVKSEVKEEPKPEAKEELSLIHI